MTDVEKSAHESCACSRNRQCAFHRAQAKKMQRVEEASFAQQKVEMGIEELRARYAKPKPAPTPSQFARQHQPRRNHVSRGWSK